MKETREIQVIFNDGIVAYIGVKSDRFTPELLDELKNLDVGSWRELDMNRFCHVASYTKIEFIG